MGTPANRYRELLQLLASNPTNDPLVIDYRLRHLNQISKEAGPNSPLQNYITATGVYLAGQAWFTNLPYHTYMSWVLRGESTVTNPFLKHSRNPALFAIAFNLARIEFYRAQEADEMGNPDQELYYTRESFALLEWANTAFDRLFKGKSVELPHPVAILGGALDIVDTRTGEGLKDVVDSLHVAFRAYAVASHELAIRLQRRAEKEEVDPNEIYLCNLNTRSAARLGQKFFEEHGCGHSPAHMNLRLAELGSAALGKNEIPKGIADLFARSKTWHKEIDAMNLSEPKKIEWHMAILTLQILLAERLNDPDKVIVRAQNETAIMSLVRDLTYKLGHVPVYLRGNGTYKEALGPSFPALLGMACYGVELSQTPPEKALPHHLQRHLRP